MRLCVVGALFAVCCYCEFVVGWLLIDVLRALRGVCCMLFVVCCLLRGSGCMLLVVG